MYTNFACGFENTFWSCIGSSPSCSSPINSDGCLRKFIAVAPHSENDLSSVLAAENFYNWTINNPRYFVNDTIFIQLKSEKEFINDITDQLYTIDSSLPIYSAAIIFESGSPSWEYTLRLNSTIKYGKDAHSDMPHTDANDIDMSVRVIFIFCSLIN